VITVAASSSGDGFSIRLDSDMGLRTFEVILATRIAADFGWILIAEMSLVSWLIAGLLGGFWRVLIDGSFFMQFRFVTLISLFFDVLFVASLVVISKYCEVDSTKSCCPLSIFALSMQASLVPCH